MSINILCTIINIVAASSAIIAAQYINNKLSNLVIDNESTYNIKINQNLYNGICKCNCCHNLIMMLCNKYNNNI